MFVCTAQLRHERDSAWSWFICTLAVLSQAVVMGLLQSFGIFLPVIIDEFNVNKEKTAWIGSVGLALSYFASPLAGLLSDRYGCRLVTIFGALACAVSLAVTSFAKTIVVIFFTYSLLFGVGASCVRTCTFLIVAKYFYRRRSLATGLVSAGPGVGMFVFGPLIQRLLVLIGLHNTYRAMTGFALLVCIFAAFFSSNVEDEMCDDKDEIKEAKLSPQRRKLMDCSPWKVPAFTIVTIAYTVSCLGDFVPLMHLVKHCKELGIPGDSASRLLMFFGLASFVSRIAIGRLGDFKKIKSRQLARFGLMGLGTSILLLPLAKSFTAFVVFSFAYGFCDGMIGSQLNLLLLTSVSPKMRASAFGLANFTVSLALMIGSPMAGLIADKIGSYLPAFYIAGGEVLLGACVTFLLFCLKSPKKSEDVEFELIPFHPDCNLSEEKAATQHQICKAWAACAPRSVRIFVELSNFQTEVSILAHAHYDSNKTTVTCTDV